MKKGALLAPLFLFLFFLAAAKQEPVAFHQLPDQHKSVESNNTIAYQARDIISLGAVLPFHKDLVPQSGDLRVVLPQLIEHLVFATTDLIERTVI